MKYTPKQEFLALGVRLARHKRDLLFKRHRFSEASQQDDVVQTHLRQFQKSLKD